MNSLHLGIFTRRRLHSRGYAEHGYDPDQSRIRAHRQPPKFNAIRRNILRAHQTLPTLFGFCASDMFHHSCC